MQWTALYSKDDCEDGSDENNEQCRAYLLDISDRSISNFYFSIETAAFACPNNQMVCPDTTIHQCVNITQVCDG
jgi:hypothetical protein